MRIVTGLFVVVIAALAGCGKSDTSVTVPDEFADRAPGNTSIQQTATEPPPPKPAGDGK